MKSTIKILVIYFSIFLVSCGDDETANSEPEISNPIQDIQLTEGFQQSIVSLSGVFNDPDGDELTYAVNSSNENVVTASVSGTSITISEVGTGTSVITVTADDNKGGSTSDLFNVSVSESPNTLPIVVNEISDQNLSEGFETVTIDLSNVFSDEDGDDLSFTSTSSNSNIVNTDISGAVLSLIEVANGEATVTVVVNDGRGGTASDDFEVIIENVNDAPIVATPIEDLDLPEGFGSELIDLLSVFDDEDEDVLTYTATSSNEEVATVAIEEGSILSVIEVGVGEVTITVDASDGESSVSDSFEVIISTCPNNNSLNTTNTVCDNSPSVANIYTEVVNDNGTRTITTNRVPEHDYGNQISNMGVMGLVSTVETFSFTRFPSLASSTTSILDDNNRPAYDYGIGLNGVPIDPAPAEPFIFENTATGEYNWDWVFEPNNNRTAVGLDCNTAHLQPTSNNMLGLIHYHGDMVVYANSLLSGLGDGTVTPSEPVQIGWASDGFPIVYKYGTDANGSGVELLESSYQLKSGFRSGDGVSEPCGAYNGKYTNDYEFVSGAGDLDACNGISRSITLTTPAGIEETFNYFYVITDEFPIIGRCLSGTPGDDFSKRP